MPVTPYQELREAVKLEVATVTSPTGQPVKVVRSTQRQWDPLTGKEVDPLVQEYSRIQIISEQEQAENQLEQLERNYVDQKQNLENQLAFCGDMLAELENAQPEATNDQKQESPDTKEA